MSTTSTSSGWNRSNSTPKPAPKKPSAFKGVLAGVLIVAALGAVCWFMFAGGDEVTVRKSEPKKTVPIKKVTPVNTPAQVAPTPSEQMAVEKSAEVEKVPVTNVITGNGYRTVIDENGKKHTIIESKEQFSGTDQMVAMITGVPLGQEPPPLPLFFGEDGGVKEFMDGLKAKIDIEEKDTAEVANRKLEIAESKLDMLELIKQGETPETVLKELYRNRQAAYVLRNEMIEDMQTWVKSESPSDLAVDTALQQFNQRLEAKGILTIKKDDVVNTEEEIEEE